MMAKYSSKVMEHFFNPRNTGELENPSGEGYSGNPSERNYMRFTIRVEGGRIAEVRFQSYTCLVAVAACSFLTEMVKGKTLEEAESISPVVLASELGEVPLERFDRCTLAVEALSNAITDYRQGESR
jgi:NifU-like protein involved in Fe-S cluster formation